MTDRAGLRSELARTFMGLGHPVRVGWEVDALDAFAEVLGDFAWTPAEPFWGAYFTALEIGALAAVLRDVPSKARKFRSGARLTADRGFPDPSLRSELHAAALLRYLGFKPQFVEEKGVPTPDLTMLVDGQNIDVEVARGDLKRSHQLLKEQLSDLAGAVPIRAGETIYVWLAAEAGEAEQEAARAAATSHLGVGQVVDDPGGRWRVAVGPAGSATGAYDPPEPSWWGTPAFVSFAASVPTPGHEAGNVNVHSRVPPASYFNPVRRKLDRLQQTGDHAFMLAFDVERMPDAVDFLSDELDAAFRGDPRISGVLLFYGFFAWGGQVEWRAALKANPNATHPLAARLKAAFTGDMARYPLASLEGPAA